MNLSAFIILTAFSAAQPTDVPIAPSAAELRVPLLSEKLLDLAPDDPMSYFLLAEEIASEVTTDDGRRFARTLFVLAHEIDRASAQPLGLSSSVYLALASLSDRAPEQEWLLALGAGTAASAGTHALPTKTDEPLSESSLLLADIITHARAQEGREVKENLRKEGVPQRLASAGPAAALVKRILESAQNEPACPGCHGKRLIRSTAPKEGGGIEETFTLCTVCRGNPGLRLNAAQFAATLAFQSELVNARHDSWAAQVMLDRGSPQRDPDPAELATYYGVNRGEVYWVPRAGASDPLQGAWSSTPTGR